MRLDIQMGIQMDIQISEKQASEKRVFYKDCKRVAPKNTENMHIDN